MMNNKKILLSALSAFVFTGVFAQDDTTALIKEFNKVMSFSVNPFVSYTTGTTVRSVPVLQQEDTMTLAGVFFKNGEDIYYKSGADEIYLEDSLLIEINHTRKTVTLNKINTDTKKNINLMPLDSKKMREMFQQRYSITKTKSGGRSSVLNFENKQEQDSVSAVSMKLGLRYSATDYTPEEMNMEVKIQQLADEVSLGQLKEEKIQTDGLVQTINNHLYFIRTQQVNVRFGKIDLTKEKAQEIPKWQDILAYDLKTDAFTGKGIYSNYELIKTF